jgi:hypothetical protein
LEDLQVGHRFEIPFTLRVSDNPFEEPDNRPPLERLRFESVSDDFPKERPVVWLTLGSEEETQLEEFVFEQIARLQLFSRLGWAQFVDRGLGFLVKAFSKAFDSDPLEQLLWHCISLEAFLGESGPGSTTRLRRRIGTIYSADANRAKNAQQAFDEIYNLRSDLVHGASFRKQAYQRHLREARSLARTVAARMISLLSDLALEVEKCRLPADLTQAELLDILDRIDRKRLLSEFERIAEEKLARLPEI